MAICTSGEKLLQEVTGIHHGPLYPVAKNDQLIYSTVLKQYTVLLNITTFIINQLKFFSK